MTSSLSAKSDYDRRSIRDNLALVGWIFAWMASLTVSAEWITWLSIAVNFALGVWVAIRFVRMLRGMDDLQRKIQFDALAFSFGVSVVATISYSLLVTWGYITDEEVSDIFVVMCVAYSLAVVTGALRYR